MKILALDDERPALFRLKQAIAEALPEAEVRDFMKAREGLACIGEGFLPDVAFLDIDMPGMTGMELAREIRTLAPAAKIVFTTGYAQYATEAFSIHAEGYLMKPVTAQKLLTEIEHLRQLAPIGAQGKRVRAQCFGSFEVYLDGEPMKFAYSKTKELLAYLIDRNGALCSGRELLAVLWGDVYDDAKTAYFRRLRADLLEVFDRAGCAECIERQHGMLGIVPGRLTCDYFDWLAGRPEAIGAYHGEYMTQYSWGEQRLGYMESLAGEP